MKIWGTCAGAILLANEVIGEPSCLGLIDIEIERNGFGSQLDSFVSEAHDPCCFSRTDTLDFYPRAENYFCGQRN